MKDLPPLYNFYHDPLVTETKLVLSPILKILQRCVFLFEEFGSNPLIEDIFHVCHFLMNEKLFEVPLMKILTSLELLLGKLESYETIASKSINSLEEQIVLIKQLIIRFRKIQILSWKNLMSAEIDQCIRKDLDNFISLSYALNGAKNEFDTIMETIDLYLRTSNIA